MIYIMDLPIQNKSQNDNNNNPIKIIGSGFYDSDDEPSDTVKGITAAIGLPLITYGSYKLYKHFNKS